MLRDLAADTSRTLPIERLDFGVPVGRLSLKLVDKGTGRPLVARVALEHADGSFHAPPGALWRIFGDVGHFYVRGEVEMNLPAGRYRLRAWHGPEYRMQQLNLELRSAETTQQTVVLERWTDPNARGWYSGENHIHANYGYGEYYNSPATMADMTAVEIAAAVQRGAGVLLPIGVMETHGPHLPTGTDALIATQMCRLTKAYAQSSAGSS